MPFFNAVLNFCSFNEFFLFLHNFICMKYFYFFSFLLSVIVSFPLLDNPDISFIAWTTTPWTLPSNLSLCVNPEMDYVKVKGKYCFELFLSLESSLSLFDIFFFALFE